jgi:nanoRNase/pAp phosphatase (c-di-AMP/oligoRNAs hydrolase)
MITTENLEQLRGLLEVTKSVVVLVGSHASPDALAVASALTAALQAQGKEVLWAGSLPLESPPEHIYNIDQYRTSLGNQNLVVSFEYSETAIENVSYHIGQESNKFFLTIKPQKGHQPLDPSSVEYSYSGTNADMVILVGVGSYESLGELYTANEQLFADAAIVSLHTYETDFGQLKLDTSGEIGMSSAAARIFRDLQIPITGETATTLLAGIEQATNNFKSLSITPDTLELSAWLMRQGARRVWRGDKELVPREVSEAGDGKSFAEVFSKTDVSNKNTVKSTKKNKATEKPGGLDYQPSSTGDSTI